MVYRQAFGIAHDQAMHVGAPAAADPSDSVVFLISLFASSGRPIVGLNQFPVGVVDQRDVAAAEFNLQGPPPWGLTSGRRSFCGPRKQRRVIAADVLEPA